MTAYINKLKDSTGNQQLPITHERAVRDDNGTTLESKIQDLEGAMDKAYVAQSDNGMGRITLKKNMVSDVNTLTQTMMQATNTIYVIRYDFTLGGRITVPENCVLEFDGGSFRNNSIDTRNIIIKKGKFLDCSIRALGDLTMVDSYVELSAGKSYLRNGCVVSEGQSTNVNIDIRNCRLINNTEDGDYSDGIKLIPEKNISFYIEGNYIKAIGRGVEDQTDGTNTCSGIFTNNRVEGGSLGVSLVCNYGKKIISDNIISATGIALEPSLSCEVYNNTVIGGVSYLISNSSYTVNDKHIIQGNTFIGLFQIELGSISAIPQGIIVKDNYIEGNIKITSIQNLLFSENTLKLNVTNEHNAIYIVNVFHSVFKQNEFYITEENTGIVLSQLDDVIFDSNLYDFTDARYYDFIKVLYLYEGSNVTYLRNRIRIKMSSYTRNERWLYRCRTSDYISNVHYIDNMFEFYNFAEVTAGVVRYIYGDDVTPADSCTERGTIIIGLTDRSNGTTAQRPALTCLKEAFSYFDKTIGKPIYWNGTAWVDATGTPV